MNDLEHDLRELFEQRASNVDVPGLAPKAVLHRGRRRQVGTVVTGVLACLVAAGVAAAGIGDARHRAVIPGRGNGLPERTTSIGGVPVTAPAGWTLVDDWPLAAVLATTNETCSFSGTGTAVDQPTDVAPVPSTTPSNEDTSGDGGSTSGQSCTSENVGYPAGIPVLQLANFAIPLTKTVCGLADQQAPLALPDDGVAVYVADLRAAPMLGDLQAACPGSDGFPASLQTFFDTAHHTDYAAIGVAGPAASDADIAVARDYIDGLSTIEVTPEPPASDTGPGYVMAAGTGGDTSWRLEAGITSLAQATPDVGAMMLTSSSSGTDATVVEFHSGERVSDDAFDLGGNAGVVQFGTASADVTAIRIGLPSGGTVRATLLPWPPTASAPTLPSPDGSVWFAQAPQRGSVQASFPSTPPSAPTPAAGGESRKLQTKTDADGTTVVYGHDLGHDWELRRVDNSFELSLDGATAPVAGSLSVAMGGSTQIDVAGGTFVIAVEDPTVQHFDVTTDATDQTPSTMIVGRSTPVRDSAGQQGALWVLALPGSGTGLESMNNELPTFVSWPSSPVRDGSLAAAGSDGIVS